jgi:hypothetical protein
MSSEQQGPFGDAMYRAQRRTFSPNGDQPRTFYGTRYAGTREHYEEARQSALEDPNFDFFEQYMPTLRTKHDIGRYALANGFEVPLIRSLRGLDNALHASGIVIRSDGVDDYTGESGLKSSAHWGFFHDDEAFHHYWLQGRVGREALQEFDEFITARVLSGHIYPGFGLEGVDSRRSSYKEQNSSLWRYVPGENITIMRDPVVEGTYHYRFGNHISTRAVGGLTAPDHPQFFQAGGHTLQKQADTAADLSQVMSDPWADELIQQMIPVSKMIETYEAVRTLPYFDQRQLPTMEMQYDGKKFHFLQYLKTGRMIENIPAFPLPDDARSLKTDDVLGATSPEGEAVRIYVGITAKNGRGVQERVKGDAVFFSDDIMISAGHSAGEFMQRIAMDAKAAIIDWPLLLHNHHFGSAMMVRTPVNLGLRGNDDYELREKLIPIHYAQVEAQFESGQPNDIGYINAVITSNGREATVSSDWELHQL